jgi:hypothetical protein
MPSFNGKGNVNYQDYFQMHFGKVDLETAIGDGNSKSQSARKTNLITDNS